MLPPHDCSDTDRDGAFDCAVPDPEVVAEAWDAWRAEVAFAERRTRGPVRGPRAAPLLSLSGSGNPPDTLDFYGLWKLPDALQDCATRRQDCQVALGRTAQQRYMGRRSRPG
jgi:hypothetical protein